MASKANSVIVTPVVRASYVQLTAPKAQAGATEKKFSMNLIFEPEDAAAIYAEIVKVATEQFGENAVALINSGGLQQPLKDGNKPNKKTLLVDPITAGKWFVTAKAAEDKQPICVDQKEQAMNASGIYSGCYVRAQISIYAFEVPTNRGIAVGLNFVQFVRDGERLGGGAPTIAGVKGVFGTVAGATPAAALPNMGFATAAPTGSLPGLPA